MTEQITPATQPAIEDTPTEASGTSSFVPQVSIHPVAALTLGRQAFNDSDKANYFGG
ncbi:hypothetical protein [Streptomyces sp. NPDC102437]|uniref:hypothetical protein n=1 Tax=Streptomyces sp. NPDC102437 TaxID=3366175 RepID=UPI0037F1333B